MVDEFDGGGFLNPTSESRGVAMGTAVHGPVLLMSGTAAGSKAPSANLRAGGELAGHSLVPHVSFFPDVVHKKKKKGAIVLEAGQQDRLVARYMSTFIARCHRGVVPSPSVSVVTYDVEGTGYEQQRETDQTFAAFDGMMVLPSTVALGMYNLANRRQLVCSRALASCDNMC